MLIRDPKGKYELRVDTERFIVYEKNMGLWNSEDISRFHNEYKLKILPLIDGREWFKCTDLREYKLSNITDAMINHVTWCVKNNLFGAIIIVKNEAIEMQMNLSVLHSGMIYSPLAFANVEDAEKWLRTHWI